MPMTVDPLLLDVLAETFGEEYRDTITLDTTMDDVETWDSAAFVDLVLAIEERFGVSLSMGETAAMTDVRSIQQVLERRRAA
jgi:acyl carrier protein